MSNGVGVLNSNWKGGRTKHDGYIMVRKPSHPRSNPNGYVMEHILVAEKALGKRLPEGVVTHHANEIRDDNRPSNFVICQNEGYHKLLHARLRAKEACGNPKARPCSYCKSYDLLSNLRPNGRGHYHKTCHAKYERNRVAGPLDARKEDTNAN